MMVSPKGVEKLYSRDNDIKKWILDMKSYDGFNIVNKFSIRNFIKTWLWLSIKPKFKIAKTLQR